MIKSLYIRDFALIDELEVRFERGLNVLTGQTGAGKSIIIGALNMILGERASTEVIRQGADKAISEAVIEAGSNEVVEKLLKENEIEYAGELILRREIRHAGSRAFINDTPVTISLLREVGDQLVDLHGQHDHQLLLKDENHLGVIDQFDLVKPHLARYRKAWEEMASLQTELKSLQKKERELREKSDLYQFQLKELEEAKLQPDEEEELVSEMNLLDHAEELDQKLRAITEMGNGDDLSLMQLLNSVKLHLEDVARIEPEFDSYLNEVNSARISLQETLQFAERYRDQIEFNPQRLETLRRRQAELLRLQKKYQRTLPELIRYTGEIRAELSAVENFDLETARINDDIEKQRKVLTDCAVALHTIRIETGEKLSDEIVESLRHLGILHGQFRVLTSWVHSEKGWIEIEGRPVTCSENGCDEVRFYISTNRGEEPKPLEKIASGGEVSRVMLALKSILARQHHLPVMIFDEIDTGISGNISEKVGQIGRAHV